MQELIEQNIGLILFALVLIVVFVVIDMTSARRKRRGRSNVLNFGDPQASPWRKKRNMANPRNQMSAIEKAGFRKVRLVNKSEYRVLLALEDTVKELGRGHRVMAQTSMGEILEPVLASSDPVLRKEAFASINSKRLDFAIFDNSGEIVIALEFQGGGHYSSGAFMRDAVKREVLRKAGVPFVEVDATWTPGSLRDRVRALLTNPPPVRPPEIRAVR